MRKITPHLWFEKDAKKAAEFYATIFPDTKITHASVISGTPPGDTEVVAFEVASQPFMAISAGPVFKINPAISFMVNYDPARDPDARDHLDEAWAKLSEGGVARMPLDAYPFSKRFGWIEDKYGVSWQLILTNPDGEERPFIVPSLLFTKEVAGRAEEAIDFYVSVFGNAPGGVPAKRGTTAKYPAGREPEKEGTIMFADFTILDTWIAAMDSAQNHPFSFNEAVSLLIPCDSQEETDYYWDKLSAGGTEGQCGWLKDRFGVSWQVHPTALDDMMSRGTPEQIARVMQAFLQMTKVDIATLQTAYEK